MPHLIILTLFDISVSMQSWSKYLDVIVNSSRHDLVTGVIERDSQHLVSVLESVDCTFLTNVPQLSFTRKEREH